MADLSSRQRFVALRLLRAILRGPSSPTGRLAAEGRIPSLASSWEGVLAAAEELLVLSELSRALRNASGLAPELSQRLRDWRRLNTFRNQALGHQLRETVLALNRAHVVPLLFKGSLHLVDGSLDSLGDRWIGDLDLLVRAAAFDSARAALEGLGYVADPAPPFFHPHEIGFSHTDGHARVDLHSELLGSDRLIGLLSASEAWQASRALPVGVGHARGLSPTHQALHNILHAAVQDLNHAIGGLPLRQLLVLANTARTHGSEIEWSAIRERMEQHSLARELRDYLWLVDRSAEVSLSTAGPTWGARLHELRVELGYALGWPPHLQRNLHFALGRTYMESLYGPVRGRFGLSRARARHAIRLLWIERSTVLDRSTQRRV